MSENIDDKIQYRGFYEFEDFQSSPCFNGSLSRPLFSDNIVVLAILVRTKYFYQSKLAEITRDNCNQKSYYKLILSDIDYDKGESDNRYASAVSVLDSVFTEQEVIFDVKFE